MVGTDTTQIATTAFVLANGDGGAQLDEANTWTMLQTFDGGADLSAEKITNVADPTDPQDAATKFYVDAEDALKANLASPTFTGTVTVPTPTNNTDATTKLYVDTADALKANLASPTFTGNVVVPTPDADNEATTKLYVDTEDNLKANLASPTFTGAVTVPATQDSDADTVAASKGYVDAGDDAYFVSNSSGTVPVAGGTDSIAIGEDASVASGSTDGIAIGKSASVVNGLESIAIGRGARADGIGSLAVGINTKAELDNTVAIGNAAEARAIHVMTIGGNGGASPQLAELHRQTESGDNDLHIATKKYVDDNSGGGAKFAVDTDGIVTGPTSAEANEMHVVTGENKWVELDSDFIGFAGSYIDVSSFTNGDPQQNTDGLWTVVSVDGDVLSLRFNLTDLNGDTVITDEVVEFFSRYALRFTSTLGVGYYYVEEINSFNTQLQLDVTFRRGVDVISPNTGIVDMAYHNNQISPVVSETTDGVVSKIPAGTDADPSSTLVYDGTGTWRTDASSWENRDDDGIVNVVRPGNSFNRIQLNNNDLLLVSGQGNDAYELQWNSPIKTVVVPAPID